MLDHNYLNQVIEDKDFNKVRNDTKFIELLKEFRTDTAQN